MTAGGNAFYLVRVRTTRSNFSEKMPIIPGMTAEVDILTGRKTVLSYLLKPVLKARERAMRRQGQANQGLQGKEIDAHAALGDAAAWPIQGLIRTSSI